MHSNYFLIFSVLFVLCTGQPVIGQSDSVNRSSELRSPIILSLGYRMPVHNTIINSGHGLAFELGINPLYYFSKKLLVGIYCGIATRDYFWSTSFNKKFSDDYANSIINKDYGDVNLEVINASKKLFAETKGSTKGLPGCETNAFHSTSMYYGLIAKIPFEKYPVIIKLYTGVTHTTFRGGEIVTKKQDYNYFSIKRSMYGFEISLFPGIKVMNRSDDFKKIARIYMGTVSFFYEYCDLNTADLYFSDGDKSVSIPFRNFLSQDFMKKYKKETSWGLKLAMNIY